MAFKLTLSSSHRVYINDGCELHRSVDHIIPNILFPLAFGARDEHMWTTGQSATLSAHASMLG